MRPWLLAAALALGAACAAVPAARGEEGEPRGPVRLLDLDIEDGAARRVFERTTGSRAVEPTRFPGRREHQDFFLDRLPLAAVLGRRLDPGVEHYRIAEKGPGVWAIEEGEALRGQTRLLARAPGRRVYIAEGEFRSLAHLLRFQGAMVITLRYREEQEGAESFLVNEPHVYVRIENLLLHGLAKLLSPIIHGIIERRVARLAAAAGAVSTRIVRDPAGLYREMQDWPEVTERDRTDFRGHFEIPEE